VLCRLSYSGDRAKATGAPGEGRVLDPGSTGEQHWVVTLTATDHAILDFERSWWMAPGAKADAIRAELSMSPSAYYRLLTALIDRPEALAADPLLVRRLRRARTDRRRTRHAGPQRKRSQP
jgi:hypothetical protein